MKNFFVSVIVCFCHFSPSFILFFTLLMFFFPTVVHLNVMLFYFEGNGILFPVGLSSFIHIIKLVFLFASLIHLINRRKALLSITLVINFMSCITTCLRTAKFVPNHYGICSSLQLPLNVDVSQISIIIVTSSSSSEFHSFSSEFHPSKVLFCPIAAWTIFTPITPTIHTAVCRDKNKLITK